MQSDKIPYRKMILVCVNDRKGEKPSCGDQQGEKIFEELRRIAKERGWHPEIRVTQAKCLGQCAKGANVMIYTRRENPPNDFDEVWYNGVTIDDVQKLADQYLPTKI